jgi:hypothetical protein
MALLPSYQFANRNASYGKFGTLTLENLTSSLPCGDVDMWVVLLHISNPRSALEIEWNPGIWLN